VAIVESLIYITVSVWLTVGSSMSALTVAFGIAISAVGMALVRAALRRPADPE
jgi:hypothetical protein